MFFGNWIRWHLLETNATGSLVSGMRQLPGHWGVQAGMDLPWISGNRPCFSFSNALRAKEAAMVTLKREWSKPSAILFATECPVNEKAFTFALAQAKETGAKLMLLHVCNEEAKPPGWICPQNHAPKHVLEALVERASKLGVPCHVEVRTGEAAEEILGFLHRRKVDRVLMGVHTPGPVGKLLVGSVAETLLRRADVPVTIVGPYLREATCLGCFTRTVLCSVSCHRSSQVVARFAADVAARLGAHLVVQQVIPQQECEETLAGRTLDEMKHNLAEMIPAKLHAGVKLQTMVTLGDPTDELLYQGRVLRANLIVMGAHNATHFAALTNACAIYKVLAYAHCPVLTLSPVILADYGPVAEMIPPRETHYLAGVV